MNGAPPRVPGWPVLLCASAALTLPPGPASAQQAYFSFEGDFPTIAGDQHDFTFSLANDQASTPGMFFRTYSGSGGTNLAGDAIANGPIDPRLDLFTGGGASVTFDDDSFSLDSQIDFTSATNGGALPDPLPAGNYRLNHSTFGNNDAGPWALDLAGPAGNLTLTGASPVNASTITSLKLGTIDTGMGTDAATFNQVGTLNLTGPLVVAQTGNALLQNLGTTTVAGPTTVNAGGTLSISGQLNANGNVAVDGGTVNTFTNANALNLAPGGTLIATNDAQINFNGPRYTLGTGRTFNLQSGSDFTTTDGLDLGSGNTGTLIVEGAGSTLDVNNGSVFAGLFGGTAAITIRDQATADVDGTIFLGTLGDHSTGTINVESGAGFTAHQNVHLADDTFGATTGSTATVNVTGAGSTFTQNGASTLTIGGSGTSTASVNIDNGTVTTGTGTTTVNATGTLTLAGGAFNANGDVVVNPGGAFNLDAGQAIVVGTISFDQGTDASLTNGWVLDADAVDFRGYGGFGSPNQPDLTGSADGRLRVNRVLNTDSGSGQTDIDGTLALGIDLPGPGESVASHTVSPGKLFNVASNLVVGHTADATFNVIADDSGFGSPTTANAGGTLIVGQLPPPPPRTTGPIALQVPSGTTGTVTVTGGGGISATLEAAGLDLRNGTVTVNPDGVLTAGDGVIHGGGTLTLAGGSINVNGNLDVLGGRLIATAGMFNVAANKTVTASDHAEIDLAFTYTSVANNVEINVTGGSTFATPSNFLIGAGNTDGTVTVTGTGSAFNQGLNGTLEIGSPLTTNPGTGALVVTNGGVVNAGNDLPRVNATGTLEVSHGGTFNAGNNLSVSGTVHINPLGTVNVANSAFIVNQTGTVNLDGGHLVADQISHTSGGAFNFLNGTLDVTNFDGTLRQHGGVLLVGGRGTDVGDTEVTGDFNVEQGVSAFEVLSDTAFDTLTVDATVNLIVQPVLDVGVFSGFGLDPGETLRIVTAGTAVQGTFIEERLPVFNGSWTFDVAYGADFIDLEVVAATTLDGDFNGSGQVEQGDLDLVLANWGVDSLIAGLPAGWVNDNGGVGLIEQVELDQVLSNWGDTVNAPDFRGTNLPEPAAASALVLMALLHRRGKVSTRTSTN